MGIELLASDDTGISWGVGQRLNAWLRDKKSLGMLLGVDEMNPEFVDDGSLAACERRKSG